MYIHSEKQNNKNNEKMNVNIISNPILGKTNGANDIPVTENIEEVEELQYEEASTPELKQLVETYDSVNQILWERICELESELINLKLEIKRLKNV